MVEDADKEEEVDDEPTTSDIPFDVEDGDRVWATGLIPEAQYIQASSTISQRLAEGFARNTEAHPTLPTSGSGSNNPESSWKRGSQNSQTKNPGITRLNWYLERS
jgi:hypothetical protein